jgi:translation elongation factor EF-4
LEDVDAFHKEVGDKCFHEDLTRGEKLSYKKSHPRGGF